ncbi:hypothetical protein [Evansella clarkii]|nr:hypothetical protein [Evansella clarkii]
MSGKIHVLYKCDGCGQTLIAKSQDNVRRVSCGTCMEKSLKKGA